MEIDKELGINVDENGLSSLSDEPNSDKKTLRYWDWIEIICVSLYISVDYLKDKNIEAVIFYNFSLADKGKSVSSENDEAVMDDVHSISSEASLTDNIPNLVTSETSLGQLQSKIENKSKKILENFAKMKISKQKYYDDRGRFLILSEF